MRRIIRDCDDKVHSTFSWSLKILKHFRECGIYESSIKNDFLFFYISLEYQVSKLYIIKYKTNSFYLILKIVLNFAVPSCARASRYIYDPEGRYIKNDSLVGARAGNIESRNREVFPRMVGGESRIFTRAISEINATVDAYRRRAPWRVLQLPPPSRRLIPDNVLILARDGRLTAANDAFMMSSSLVCFSSIHIRYILLNI